MQSKRTRLDRYISQKIAINRKDVRLILAQGRVKIDGEVAFDIHQLVDEFNCVLLDDQILQNKAPIYLMLHKPAGVVCATKDKNHITVIDVLKKSMTDNESKLLDIDNLHLVGRLDFNSTGLVLLTNDGRWSRKITTPEEKIAKIYRVSLVHPIAPECVEAFAKGMYFEFENITTRPAKLEIINPCEAIVTLEEGRYHQIKRMFGRFQNPVVELHRLAIGSIKLDLNAGHWRLLETSEIL